MSQKEYDLGSAELEMLRVLWDHGPLNVRGVMNALHEQDRTVAYTTVQTTLTRLEQKGFVRSDRSGQAFVFTAVLTRDELSRSRLRKLVDQLYDGAAGALVLHLVKTQKLKPREIEELHRLVERLDKKKE